METSYWRKCSSCKKEIRFNTNYITKKYAKKIGVRGNITIHSARSTVIGMLLDRGHAIERVADFVGHKDMGMTRAYNKRRQKIHDSLSLDL